MLLGTTLLAAFAVDGYEESTSFSTPEVSAASRELVLQVDRRVDSQRRLAVWCDARSLDVERVEHLAIAEVAEHRHATCLGC